MQVTFHGHSCFEIQHESYRVIIDPFLQGNPKAIKKPEEIQVDAILLTHGHNDHIGDTVQIAKQNDALVISTFEIATWLRWQGVKTHEMGIGGSYDFPFGKVTFTLAHHSSSYVPDEEKQQLIYMGNPAGLVLEMGGKRIYHAGDTALFSDMKLIPQGKSIDLALLPVGDNFTMGPEEALQAAEWVKAKQVVPMHYDTFPVIEQDVQPFVNALSKRGIGGHPLQVGESITF